MSKDIKKALEHCVEWNCADCPNREELGSGETVCRGRLLPEVLEYVANLEAKLAESETDKKALISDYESRITKHQELMSWLEHNNEELKQQLAEKERQLKLAEELLIKQEKEYDEQLEKQAKIHYKHLNEKDQRIAELEEQLKNSIRPKFKIGQEVWFVSDPYTARYAKVRHMKIEEISISSIFVERGVMYAGDDWAGISESELFATKQEAEAKLKELGEKK